MKGKHKIFLGYAAGVGKTYQMLEAGQELHRKGVDTVIGYFEPHGRKDTMAKTEGLETVPRRTISHRGSTFEDMDTEAILRRRPAVCLVDELAHTNVPGSERQKRWQDVMVLLEAGIDVYSSLNVQHLESLNDQILQITGVRVRETVPDWIVDEADEIVFVDVTARALRHRLERGVVYSPEKAHKALDSFFTEPNLNALREIAMRHTAHEIEDRLSDLEESSGPNPVPTVFGGPATDRKDCVLVCIDERPSTAIVIRRAKRVADYLRAPCLAVYFTQDSSLGLIQGMDRDMVEKHLAFSRNLHIETKVLEGKNMPDAVVNFAREHHVTQIFMGRPERRNWTAFGRASDLQQIVSMARDMEITIVAERRRNS
jgi:two-component system sensor histidine kinase KdpD